MKRASLLYKPKDLEIANKCAIQADYITLAIESSSKRQFLAK